MKTEQQGLNERAKRVLGLTEKTKMNAEELKKAFRVGVKKTHPDLTRNSETGKYFQLIIQAKEFLGGFSDTTLLRDDDLIEKFLGESIEKLGKSYQEEIISRGFYDFIKS